MSDNRRGFLQTLGSLFSRAGDSIFIGLQMVINVAGEEGLRGKLHRVVEQPGIIESPVEKRAYYKRVTSLLRNDLPFLEYGFWDFVSRAGQAEQEFHTWLNDIEAAMATEDLETGEEADEMFRISTEDQYVVVTLLFLVENASPLSSVFQMLDAIPADGNHSRETYGTILDAIDRIDFDYCLGDASFIMPGNDEDGISFEEIRGEGWEYLHPIVGL